MKSPHCPYYEQKTSYGTELVKCNNEKCEEGELMIKLLKGQTVYTVGEAWRYDDYIARTYYDVYKCKVDLVPREGLREYRLVSHSKPLQLFFRPRGQIYLTYAEALEVAKAEADKEDKRNKMYGINTRVYRPWERTENVRQTPSGQLQMAL